jgi:hypothetical protein
MMRFLLRVRRALPLAVTAASLAGFVQLHLLHPPRAEAQSFCANGRCTSATVCQYRAGESCAFMDARTCVTYRCSQNES